ncbi:MAG TPA: VWA domain-containing protein [Saprospiraceae bacterium]|nr:VWA domain-containing protein [Saprospiraceae bacterium]HMX83764.1 VWA domain-containing protein [Saprospiraceae bacterium]HNA41426.1 VWA domain-containing protein [Saprospiraceae bacterium]HNA93694.1 VWA domain-containing protein [Saprospiraceae bacterium]HND15473.1 VWA domain-containing protein [Saprospiraceae bacterium]
MMDAGNILTQCLSGSMHWANAWVLWLIPVIWILYLAIKKRQVKSFRFSDLSGIKTTATTKVSLLKFLPLLQLTGFSFLLLALARPQIFLKDETIKANGIDIILSLDVSSSMLSKDFEPDRLSNAKKVADNFIDQRKYDRIGLVIFSGEAFTQCPLTSDHEILRELLKNVEPGILEDGTAIGMGLATAVNRLKNSQAKSKIVILMTDGVNNAGYIKPQTALNLAKTLGIKVYTIGIGSTGQALTPVARRYDGTYVYGVANVEIDEKLLSEIAESTGGRYFRATTGTELSDIYRDIDRMEKTTIDVKTMKKYSEEYRYFLLIACMIFGLAAFLKYFYIKPLIN